MAPLAPCNAPRRLIAWMIAATACCVYGGAAVASDTAAAAGKRSPFADRADALLRQLTLEEKVAQLSTTAPAVTRGSRVLMPAFEWWSECLHGVKEDQDGMGGGTLFPQPIGLAASFDADLVHEVATAIGSELRAKSNAAEQRGLGPRMTLCFGPTINLARDPRWGRASETWGEDPALTASMAAAFVRGLQGNDSRYLRAGATCKHFAAYSFEEWEGVARFEFDARVDARDWRDSYLPAFQACAGEAAAAGVMCAYSALNGTPACASDWLLQRQLRERVGFGGFVVSDCGALNSITDHHEWTKRHAQGFAAALRAGTDLACQDFGPIRESLAEGLADEADVDVAVRRLLLARFAMGHFDVPGDDNPYRRVPPSVVGSRRHAALARRAAAASVVLLKNDPPFPAAPGPVAARAAAEPRGPLLPLALGALRRITVLGPLANRSEYLLGTYYGHPSGPVPTPFQAIVDRAAAHGRDWGGGGVAVELLTGTEVMGAGADTEAAVAACRRSDVCVFCIGTSSVWAMGREASRFGTLPLLSPIVETEGFDRKSLLLPGRQLNLVQAVAKRSATPIVVLLLHGAPLDVSWLQGSPRVAAVLTAWQPGQGGAAVADVLFGAAAPAGRLPISWPFQNYTAQADFADMGMRRWPGRTHRYLQVPVLYPFGHGLSYTAFAYSPLAVAPAPAAAHADGGGGGGGPPLLRVSLSLTNAGGVASEEVVLLLLSFNGSAGWQGQWRRWWLPAAPWAAPARGPGEAVLTLPCSPGGDAAAAAGELPLQTLAGFRRVASLRPGAAAAVSFSLTARDWRPYSPLGDDPTHEPPPFCGRYVLRAQGGGEPLVLRLESGDGWGSGWQ